MNRDEMYLSLGVSDKVLQFGEAVLDELKPRFAEIEEIAELNQAKVIGAMQKNRVNATHFAASTGYGYDDEGRDNLERVYTSAFHTEAALVRPQITCGTHALAIALSANLLPGDELLAISGKPYDTLEEVIGIRESPCSLKEYGVSYAQVDLLEDGSFDFPAIERALNDKTKLIHIQRSKGYCPRPTISVDAIGEAIAFCKKLRPDVVIMVDNCYGEFVEANEPSDFGADMIVGSLIKKPRRWPCPDRRLHLRHAKMCRPLRLPPFRPRTWAGGRRKSRIDACAVSGLLPRPQRRFRRGQGRGVRRRML